MNQEIRQPWNHGRLDPLPDATTARLRSLPYRKAQRATNASRRRGWRLVQTKDGKLLASDGTVYVLAPDGARHRLGVKVPRKERKRRAMELRQGMATAG